MQLDHVNGRRQRAEVNVTPLIDVVLVLLIAFMVLMPMAIKHHTVVIPPEAASPVVQTQPPLVVQYTADRQISVNTVPVTWQDFPGYLAKEIGGRRDKVVFFRPAENAPYSEVVRLMDLSRGAGATRLAIDSGPKP